MAISDLFRPKHKHSKSEVRASAVAAMDKDDIELLVDVAKTDRETAIRRSAIAKIADPETLAKVADAQDDNKLRDYASGLAVDIWVGKAIASNDETVAMQSFALAANHGGDRAVTEIASSAQLSVVRTEALARIKDQRALGQVVRKLQRAEEWQSALGKISDEQVLRGIAIDEKRKEVAIAALECIASEEALLEIASKAKVKSVRTRAKRSKTARTSGQAQSANQSDDQKRAKAERNQLIRTIESLAGGDEWLQSRATVDDAHQRWTELGTPSSKVQTRFDKACARFEKNYSRYHKAALAVAEKAAQAERVPPPLAESLPEPAVSGAAEASSIAAEASSATEASPSVAPEPVKTAPKVQAPDTSAEDTQLDNQDDLERLCETLEELLVSPQLRGLDKALKETDRARRNIGALPAASAQALRTRYEEARRKSVILLGELREAEEWKRWSAVPKMEALILKAKQLLATTDHPKRGDELKTLQKDWRALGSGPRDKGEELWKQFKASCDEVYEQVKAERSERSAVQEENYRQKEALCVRAEELQHSTDWTATSAIFKELQAAWKEVGPVPRRKSDGLWKRFRGACDAFFAARAPHLEEKFNELADNLDAKQALLRDIETLADTEVDIDGVEEQISSVRSLQNAWRDIGNVAREEYEALNASYRQACDRVYAKRDVLKQAALEADRTLIADIEAQIGECSDAGWESDAAEIAAKVLALRTAYLSLDSELPGREELGEKVQALIVSQLTDEPEAYKGSVLDVDKSAASREALIAEALSQVPESNDNLDQSPEAIAERLRAALNDRALGGVLSKDGQSPEEVVAALQAKYAALSPVPGPRGVDLDNQFAAACQQLVPTNE